MLIMLLLTLPMLGKAVEIICDASMVAIGVTLLRKGRLVAFESCKLSRVGNI